MTTATPSSCELKTSFLRDLLDPANDGRLKFRYAAGSAYCDLGSRLARISLSDGPDDEIESAGLEIQITEGGGILHGRSLPFSELHPLVATNAGPEEREFDPGFWAPPVYAMLEKDSKGVPRMALVSFDEVDPSKRHPIAPSKEWMGPVISLLNAFE